MYSASLQETLRASKIFRIDASLLLTCCGLHDTLFDTMFYNKTGRVPNHLWLLFRIKTESMDSWAIRKGTKQNDSFKYYPTVTFWKKSLILEEIFERTEMLIEGRADKI